MKRRLAPRSAQYGQACLRCVTAKCRCISRPNGEGCERCHRLSKQCQPNQSASQRTAKNIQDRDPDSRIDPPHSVDPEDPEDPEDPGDRGDRQHAEDPVRSEPLTVQTAAHEHSVAATVPQSVQSVDDISVACLDSFRIRMLPHFPFIYLAQSLTAEELHRNRPLLFQAIVCVTWPFSGEREARALDTKRTLCEEAFLRQGRAGMNQSSSIDPALDLLLALMTYISWGWDHVRRRGSLSPLVMLCMSLVGEMRLDRPALTDGHTGRLLVLPLSTLTQDNPRQLSAEARRAALGCFVLSSVVSHHFRDMDPLAWTPQLESVLRDTNSAEACSTDADLVYQVRLQLLSVKATQLHKKLQTQLNHDDQGERSAPTIFKDAKTLHQKLQEFRRAPLLPSRNHQLQLAQFNYVEVLILETIRASTLILSRVNTPGTTNTPGTSDDGSIQDSTSVGQSDLTYMWQSVLAISACTSALLSHQPPSFLSIAFLQWSQLAGCIVVLDELEKLEDARIDRAHARAVIDLPVLLDRIAENLELTAIEAGEQDAGPSGGVFAQLAVGIRDFRSCIQYSAVELTRPGPDEVSGCGGSNAAQPLQGHLNTQGPNSRFWMNQLFPS
ncbi:hypothetical protein F4777DRAFT_55533 [Nemania sp. FL0916]|nr:hypothetical protein F4777DRAFT_55533 [Nemania sp. FL0916]